jgi:HK97 family phage major capsid protein
MSSTRRAALVAQKSAQLKAAREIATRAEKAGRDFTASERSQVQTAVEAARKAHQSILELDGDTHMLDDINRLGDAVGGRDDRLGGRRGTSWSKAMDAHLGLVGAKGLTISGEITVPAISPEIVTIGDRPRSILELIPFQPLDGSGQYGFIRESSRTVRASTVAIGKKKPESDYELERVDDRAKTIAHIAIVDRALIADTPSLAEFLNGSLRDGVEVELEDQILNGNGATTGVLDDMVGILNTSGIQAQPWVTDRFLTARKAVTKLENVPKVNLDAVAWVMSPNEWEAYETSTDSDHYVLGTPGGAGRTVPLDRARRTLWGYPVVTSLAMADGASLLGDFGGSVEIRERESLTVEWTQTGYVADLFGAGVGGDLFEANKIRFRCEGRWGEAVKRPAGFVEVDLTA